MKHNLINQLKDIGIINPKNLIYNPSYEKLFNEVPNNLHNSLNDVLVCFRCYYKLRYNMDILQEDDKMRGFECF